MTVCVPCQLYLLRDASENLIFQNLPMHGEVNTADRIYTPWHNILIIVYLIDLMLSKIGKNMISANCIQKHK